MMQKLGEQSEEGVKIMIHPAGLIMNKRLLFPIHLDFFRPNISTVILYFHKTSSYLLMKIETVLRFEC